MSEQEPTVGEEVNEAVRNMLPWFTSLVLHAGVVLLAMFAAWTYITPVDETMPIRPSVQLAPMMPSELQDAANPLGPSVEPEVRRVEVETVGLSDAVVFKGFDERMLHVPGTGNPEPMAPTGKPDLTRQWLHGGDAMRIAYVIDASGSLIDTLPFVIQELKKSIRQMRPPQEFTIIFFQGGDAIEVPPVGFKQAGEEMRKHVADWITLENGNLVPRGSSSPVKALELAMRYRPQLLFILSDNITGRGRYEVDRGQLLEMLRESNPVVDPKAGRRRTTINTIQFLYPDAQETLHQIAQEHGGVFRQVRESDLGLR